ncbi:hypothetical protein H2204_003425 [Knufia peltigerae]|uniref:Major facilitator superfamily (MFS) profile domain-containing protein n=1 Tax=Knufia peltigerae TaxID=1002370 RepID=A0AA38YAU6_9EURO|nr:hypothetical protein H2204_003425 [Knufia peltigerae]
MDDKVTPPQMVEATGSDQSDSSPDEKHTPPSLIQVPNNVDVNAPRGRFAFGAQGKSLLRMITGCGAIGFMLFGYDQGVLGGINTSNDFLAQFGYPSSSLLGTINAIYEIGCFAGAINVFLVGEKIGRRKCLYVGALLMGIGAILQASAFGVPQMIVGRVVCGWGNGFNTATTPIWVSELSPAKSRGRMVAAEGSLIAFGIVIASYYNIGMYYAKGPVVWRAPIASQLIFIIAQVAMVVVLPESPRWLARHGRHQEAVDILAQLKGHDTPLDDPAVLTKKAEIDQILQLEHADGPWHIKECFRSGPLKIRRRYLLAIVDLGRSHEFALQLAAGLAVTYWVFSFIPWMWLDKISRRQPLVIGAFVCSFCFLIAAILQSEEGSNTRIQASLAFFFLFEAVFAIGWLPVPWLYPAEIMPLRHRTHSAALATAADWIFNYMIVQVTPIMISNIRWKSYMVFFVLNFAHGVVVFLFFPETSGKSLEEMDSMFMGNNDRILVVDKKGSLLPGFRGRYDGSDDFSIATTTGVNLIA